ncbi:MAG: hypothetical protein ACP5D6_08570 [Kosmotogaceae bacterium]
MKKIYQFVLTIFFVINLAVPISWIIRSDETQNVSVVEARNLEALQPAATPNLQRVIGLINSGNYFDAGKILLNLYMNASFVEKFERATSDQFPYRMLIIESSKILDRWIIKLVYSFTEDSTYPADMTSDIYYDIENNQLLDPLNIFDTNSIRNINLRIENYKNLINAHPDLNFYLYYHQNIEDSEFHPLSPYFANADNGQSINYFEDRLPDGLILKKFMLTDMNDHMKYYYRTDHHWNVNGILRAYRDIYTMLSMNYPEISPILDHNQIINYPDIEFLGRMARLTLFPIEGDNFSTEIVDFPPHEIKIDGQEINEMPRVKYLKGNYSKNPYINHYNEFYGNVSGIVEYTFKNNSNRNLLIIGSSYRYALDPLLASHYNKTYCVDLRSYTDFSLSDFLETHNIDDFLIVGENSVLFQDIEYWSIGE